MFGPKFIIPYATRGESNQYAVTKTKGVVASFVTLYSPSNFEPCQCGKVLHYNHTAEVPKS